MAEEVCMIATRQMFYARLPQVKGTAGGVAFLFDEVMPASPAYRWTLNHTGHPYKSVAWLASKLAQFGERISAGDYIMIGSFTRQFPLAQGDRIEAMFDGIGAVTAGVV
jgi:hypothetical protein